MGLEDTKFSTKNLHYTNFESEIMFYSIHQNKNNFQKNFSENFYGIRRNSTFTKKFFSFTIKYLDI